MRRRLARALCRAAALLLLAWGVTLALPHGIAQADTLRLKNGRTLEGEVLRDDPAGVVIVTGGGPEVVPRQDIEAITYSRMRLAPSTQPAPAAYDAGAPGPGVDLRLLARLRQRLETFAAIPWHIGRIAEALNRGKRAAAARETVRMVRTLWDFPIGMERAEWIIADLLLVILLWAPALWMGLALGRATRSLTQIVLFLCAGYGIWVLAAALLLLPLAASSDTSWLGLMLGVLGLGCGVAIVAFRWAFGLTWGAVLVACGTAALVVAGCQTLLARVG